MLKIRNQGFTLIEIMLVVIIITVLAAMALPNIVGRGEQARVSAAKADIEANLSTGLDLFNLDVGRYPNTQEGLQALLQKPSSGTGIEMWKGPYLKKRIIPTDPWGRAYVYSAPGTHNRDSYDLSSTGPDGIESKDDIVNWVVTNDQKR